ncbi:general transcription factor 3C polypeptide 6-like isoform X2 [Mizuhopecten yessoensis]|uniref:General transcription factor 3C polypeptide 6 n=1 Tax=Mizuhopecten yessoensis TaxID=6573 RepID=A0A210PEZ9_MIZYE|nr:general transcription factor 3C polypeptide 6-like isoform X2 [Mizuhopecten yessoensis]OWF35064.1 General transcription factor 3C polypeptide 6 [Mizuhopecten yessoensis]
MAEHTGNEAESDEWEEEETTVIVELSGILESDFISQCDGDCKVLGIDTDKPLLQLDRYTFSGEYCDTMGTNLIFTQEDEVNEEPKPFQESADRPTKRLEYLCKVDKKLNMSRVFVSKTPQDEVDRDFEEDNPIDEGNEEKEMDIDLSGNKSNVETSDTDRTAMSVDTAGSTVTTQQMDTSRAASSSQTETPSVVAVGQEMNTSNDAPVCPEKQCEPDG